MSSKTSSTRSTRKAAPSNGHIHNIKHPDIEGQVEVAFKVGSKPYYRFKDDFQMPAGRYKYVYAYLREVDLRMELDMLRTYVQELKRCLNPSGKQIDLETAWKIIFNLESRTNLAFEPETVRRLATVVYFDATEDLITYDKSYGDKKLKFWTANNVKDFFLTRPMSEFLGLTGISLTSLEEYLTTAEGILQDLTSVPLSPSSEST
jgi:hypothetical protein